MAAKYELKFPQAVAGSLPIALASPVRESEGAEAAAPHRAIRDLGCKNGLAGYLRQIARRPD
jgi:hypothetical protein